MNRKVIASLIIIATCCLSTAFADVIWIGRPTLRDYFAYSAQRAFEQAQEMQQNMAAFNRQISDARTAYFSASPANRAGAGDRFGELLLEKDLLIATSEVMGGGGDPAKVMNLLMRIAGNGELPDKGIPASAASAYGEWISDMQRRSGGGFGAMPDPIKSAQALLQGGSLKSYEKYRRLRDQAEFDEDEASRNGGVRRLMEHASFPATTLILKTDAIGFDSRVRSLSEKILVCIYAGMTSTKYYFWEGRAPDNITALMAMNYTAGSTTLGLLKDHAVSACPADSKQAAVLASTNLKEPLTTPMLREGRSQAQSMPLTPEQAAQQEASRRAATDRKAQSDARAEAFRACNEPWLAEIAAARREHRQAKGSIANSECNARARLDHPENVPAYESARVEQANDRRANGLALSVDLKECVLQFKAATQTGAVSREAQIVARQQYDQCATAARSKYSRLRYLDRQRCASAPGRVGMCGE
ncbi:hypothetical protein [Rhizobacter fulvus]